MKQTRQRWLIPVAVALLAVAGAILLGQGASQAEPLGTDLVVTKTVDKPVAAPGDMVVYTVVLSNSSATTMTVVPLVDTLPQGFVYVSLASGSEWPEEPTFEPPQVRWEEPITVSAASSLTLQYSVLISEGLPLSDTPHTNVVTATVGESSYGDQAAVLLGLGEVSLTKTAAPTPVQPGEDITFTLSFSNSGYVTVPLQMITDVLPSGLSFAAMAPASDVPTSPVGVTGTITWTGPFTIPSHAGFRVEFRATTPVTSDTLRLENRAWGRLGDGTVLSDSVAVEVGEMGAKTVFMPLIVRDYAPPAFRATKSVDPTTVIGERAAETITYTVVFSNVGTEAGVLADVRDMLPAGFTFQQMAPGSDVTAAPSGTEGEIVWTGPFTVAGRSSLKLVYRVLASTVVGTYNNSATATVSKGIPPEGPAIAAMEVKEPYLLLEDFESPSPYWEPFLNYWRLNEEQWHYKPGGSYDGSQALGHTFWFGVSEPGDGAHDALFTYQGPGAEQWTDYVYKARAVLHFDDGTGRGQFGLFFRGTVDQSEGQPGGRYVTGYYFTVKPSPTKAVFLMQMRTDDECGDDCNFNYHFSNPIVVDILKGQEDLEAKGLDLEPGRWYWLRVEVRGPQIRCYVDDILVFDYYDNIGTVFTAGTVGFVTYIAGDARFDSVSVEPLE